MTLCGSNSRRPDLRHYYRLADKPELTDSWMHSCDTITKISGPRTQFLVVSWPEERSFQADRKVSSSAQTRPVPPWNPGIDATPLKSAPVSLSP